MKSDYPTPQGVAWDTPRVAETPDQPGASQEAQEEEDQSRAVPESPPRITGVGCGIDEGLIRKDLNQASIPELQALIRAALTASKEGDEGEAEANLRDALSGFNRLLSPTHDETVKTGYRLASYYADQKRMADADSILNWMTYKHYRRFGADHGKPMTHIFRVVSLLRLWLRNEHAEALVQRLLETLEDPDETYCTIPRPGEGGESVLKESFQAMLASSNKDKLATFLSVLEFMASSRENH